MNFIAGKANATRPLGISNFEDKQANTFCLSG